MIFINKITSKPVTPKTFSEIMKTHNTEVPMANLLEFFFKPNEKHNLGDLFIKSLLNTPCLELKNNKKKHELQQ